MQATRKHYIQHNGYTRTFGQTSAKHMEQFGNLSEVRKNAIKSAGLSDEQINKIIIPVEGIYLIVDHIRTLIFAISDGALPSNVGGGYNLRIMLRRIISKWIDYR